MKFRGLKTLLRLTTEKSFEEIQQALQDLFVGLLRLNFEENFKSFMWTGTIAATTEVAIGNPMDKIPTKYLVVRNSSGMAIGDGPTPWTASVVYLKNYGASSATITVVFMR